MEIPPGVGRPGRYRVSYDELARQAAAVAAWLRPVVVRECIVAIMAPRSAPELYSLQLGVLKAGAAYTCIDPAVPDEWMRYILDDSAAVALLTDRAGVERVQALGHATMPVLDIATVPRLARAPESPDAPPSWLTPETLAYVIYTSGTTGRPKGVMIEHRSIGNLVADDLETFGLTVRDRVAQISSPAYDSSVEETWLAFAAGAVLVVMDEDTARSGPDLVPWLRHERITVLCPTPTLLRATGCTDPDVALPDLSLLYVGGEALPDDVADVWARGRRLVNGYGPTECSVTALRARVGPGETVTIGRPVRSAFAVALDESQNEVADGVRGELCLGGIGLARGYLNLPGLTADKFVTHPRLGRLYRTGDLVHRDAGGSFHYHGRIDSQVKIRGHRVELGEVEARIVECAGVRTAACRMQDEEGHSVLVAFIVPDDADACFDLDAVARRLRATLPAHMVPSRFGLIDELPMTVAGKLDRAALPRLAADESGPEAAVPPGDDVEVAIAAAVGQVLSRRGEISVDADFFTDLGGESVKAAELVSRLRRDDATSSLAVRDVYEARTVAGLARLVRARGRPKEQAGVASSAGRSGRPVVATLVQMTFVLTGVLLASVLAYLLAFDLLPEAARRLGLIPLALLLPFVPGAVVVAYTPLAILLAVSAKYVLIGRYRPMRVPAWGSFHVRNWLVVRVARLVPWWLLEGTVFQPAVLRALGARVGKRVHIHRGVDLTQGGWDLLEIGDDVTLSQDASLRLVELEDGHLVFGAVSLGNEVTLETRAAVGGNTVLEAGAYITASSYVMPGSRIPAGERWDGIPAKHAGLAPPAPEVPRSTRRAAAVIGGLALMLARYGMGLVLLLPLEVLTILTTLSYRADAEDVLAWLFNPASDLSALSPVVGVVLATVPLTLALQAVVVRGLGQVSPGVISRRSLAYVRVWLKTALVRSAGEWLSGTLMWPVWLRWAGMRIGRGCEISTIIDVVPELVEIGEETFFADGVYLGGPRIHRGTVTLAPTRIGARSFVGNHAVIPAGARLPDGLLIGVCTTADGSKMGPGSAWFGHPAFELPTREVVETDRRFTHDPDPVRYANRVLWEVLRVGLPAVPLLLVVGWLKFVASVEATVSSPLWLGLAVSASTLAAAIGLTVLVLALKWLLLGRVRPGQHPLWSCWCSRWDFLYMIWGFWARPALAFFDGTLLTSWYLRGMGARIGKRVLLGRGFAQVVDPDMLHIEDDATVSCMFQAHTFEDRVLKIDRIWVRRGATLGSGSVPLYGAEIEAGSLVAPQSVVMKHERVAAGQTYVGCPTRPLLSPLLPSSSDRHPDRR